jgi:hypothetical protein
LALTLLRIRSPAWKAHKLRQLLLLVTIGAATVTRRLSRISGRSQQISIRQDGDSRAIAAEFASLRQDLVIDEPRLGRGQPSDQRNCPQFRRYSDAARPRLLGHWVNREVVVCFLILIGFEIGGWVLFPRSDSPTKFKAQTYSAGRSSVPQFIPGAL